MKAGEDGNFSKFPVHGSIFVSGHAFEQLHYHGSSYIPSVRTICPCMPIPTRNIMQDLVKNLVRIWQDF